jgi:hypothetical protein
LTSYVTKHPDCFLATHQGVPKTWSIDISWADELDEMWFGELYELGRLLDENGERDSKKWFIVKPSMSDRGQGIRLFETKDSLREIFESFEYGGSDNGNESDLPTSNGQADTSIIASQLRHFVIQVDRSTIPYHSKTYLHLRSTSPRHCYLIQMPSSFHISHRRTFLLDPAKYGCVSDVRGTILYPV